MHVEVRQVQAPERTRLAEVPAKLFELLRVPERGPSQVQAKKPVAAHQLGQALEYFFIVEGHLGQLQLLNL